MRPNVPELRTDVISDLQELDHRDAMKRDRTDTMDRPTESLKQTTARGALFSSGAQAVSFVLRTLSMVVMARLLFPKDFGLVGMVTAATGFIGLFRDAGLSLATIQRNTLTKGHVFTLFWVNLGVGCLLAALSALMAPALVSFYHEPRLFWITVALGMAFIFQGASAQHRAILQRNMRFRKLALIDTVSWAGSITLAISMAAAGCGYWALVGMTIGQTMLNSVGTWLAEGWTPGAPGPLAEIRTMLRFGGAVSLNTVLSYLAYNTDKILLGRFWGADTLGIYGRAYQLANLPNENLNSTLALVAFPALSRLQNEPARLQNYFLKGYRLFLSLSVPLTASFALFADDIILVFLGPRWHEAAPVFRLLAPTVTAFGLINPLFWLLLATGQVKRSLKMGMAITPLIICGYTLGLSRGPNGVAAGFSMTMILLAAPLILFWTQYGPKGTVVKWKDMLRSMMPPLLSAAAAALATLAVQVCFERVAPPILRLGVATSIFFGVYLLVLLFAMKQLPLFQSFLHEIGLWPLPRLRVRTIGSV
jgi:O-antigen/teichoic acid export membrane protein